MLRLFKPKMLLFPLLLLLLSPWPAISADKLPQLFAQRGPQGLPAHSLPGLTLAAAAGADAIVLPTQLTGDGQLVVYRELTLEAGTNASDLFADKEREDGHFYLIDFVQEELRQIRLGGELGLGQPLPTLAEALALLAFLQEYRGTPIIPIIELRHSWFSQHAGLDPATVLLESLQDGDHLAAFTATYLQSFDPDLLQRLALDLLPSYGRQLPLIQMVGMADGQDQQQLVLGQWTPYDFDWLFTNLGQKMVAGYATIIVLPAAKLLSLEPQERQLLVADLRRTGLRVMVSALPEVVGEQTEQRVQTLREFSAELQLDGFYSNDIRQDLELLRQIQAEAAAKEELPPFFQKLDLTPVSPRTEGLQPSPPSHQPQESLPMLNNPLALPEQDGYQ